MPQRTLLLRFLFVVLPLLFVLLPLAPASAADEGIRNGDFEGGAPGAAPPGWFLPPVCRSAGFTAKVTTDDPHEGKACACVAYEGQGPAKGFGNLMQTVDAAPYQGKRVRLTAAVRVKGARAQLWLRVDRANGEMGFFDNMGDRPVRSSRWKEVEIVGDIDPDAQTLNIGLMLLGGGGTACVDAVKLEVAGAALPAYTAEPPRPLRGRARENLVAFARLLGYVRHFHPSDEASATDWERLAVAGVRAVEGARSSGDLKKALETVFGPVAPGVQVLRKGQKPDRKKLLRRPAGDGPFFVRSWHHRGFGQEGGIYNSTRRKEPLPASGLPEGAADPAEPFVADLGGGVACAVPLSVYATAEASLPAATGAPATDDLPDNYQATGNDRATRLGAVVLAWNVFQHFYPYFDVAGTDWEAELPKALAAAAEDADQVAFLWTLRRMVAALKDGHGGVYASFGNPQWRLPLLWEVVEGQLTVTRVGASLEGRLHPGDVVTSIDRVPALKALAEVEAPISGATPQWIRYRGLMELARAAAKEPRTLRVLGEGDEKRKVEVVPAAIDETPQETRPDPVAELEPGIWYVDLGRIDNDGFRKAVPDLAAAKGIVFDMRGYPSNLQFQTFFPHLVKEHATSAQWRVPIVTRPDREDMDCPKMGGWQIEPREPYFEAKRAFVIDGRAISYAESCMGIVEHYQLGELVGEATAGTNGNVNPFGVPGGYRIIWTGMKVLKHDGTRHHGVGILPTIPVTKTRKGVAEGRDEYLARAIEAVR